MKKDKWIFMPHPAHFILSDRCRFVLATYVGGYIISTVGELLVRPEDKEYGNVGFNRKYETMVFKSEKSEEKCCPFTIKVEDNVQTEGYNTAEEARKGHMKLCNKWSKVK